MANRVSRRNLRPALLAAGDRDERQRERAGGQREQVELALRERRAVPAHARRAHRAGRCRPRWVLLRRSTRRSISSEPRASTPPRARRRGGRRAGRASAADPLRRGPRTRCREPGAPSAVRAGRGGGIPLVLRCAAGDRLIRSGRVAAVRDVQVPPRRRHPPRQPAAGARPLRGAPVEECRRATRRALENLVRLAVEEKVAFVLIVGDLYDGDWPDYNTGLFFAPDGPAPRGEDPGRPDPRQPRRREHDDPRPEAAGQRPRALDRPARDDHLRRRRRGDPRPELPDPRGARTTWPGPTPTASPACSTSGCCTPASTAARGTSGTPRARSTTCGSASTATGPSATSTSARCSARLDPVIAFPGNVQGRNVRESGPKGCLLVTVDDAQNVTAESRWLDVVRWGVCRVDAAGACDGDDLLDRFRDRLSALLPDLDDRLLALRVEVHGACAAHASVSADWNLWTNRDPPDRHRRRRRAASGSRRSSRRPGPPSRPPTSTPTAPSPS